MKKKNEKVSKLNQWIERRKRNPDFIATGLMVHLTEEITRAMADLKWTRSKLASKLNCSTAYVTKLLRGEENLTIKKIAQIASVLGLSPKIILDGDQHTVEAKANEYTVRLVGSDVFPVLWDFDGGLLGKSYTIWQITPENPVVNPETNIDYANSARC